jgi:FlaG/FlaF family flagellin (archaellin)
MSDDLDKEIKNLDSKHKEEIKSLQDNYNKKIKDINTSIKQITGDSDATQSSIYKLFLNNLD